MFIINGKWKVVNECHSLNEMWKIMVEMYPIWIKNGCPVMNSFTNNELDDELKILIHYE
jgi:hypothetical protein